MTLTKEKDICLDCRRINILYCRLGGSFYRALQALLGNIKCEKHKDDIN